MRAPAFPAPAPPGPACTAEELRAAVANEMRVWRLGRPELARRSGATVKAIGAWLEQDARFVPGEDWLTAVREAWLACVRDRARAYLERWDPTHYGRAAAALAEQTAQAKADLEARLAAAREVA